MGKYVDVITLNESLPLYFLDVARCTFSSWVDVSNVYHDVCTYVLQPLLTTPF
jgi:hypothetical protein